MNTPNSNHIPVLLEEVVNLLAPRARETYFDGTAGYGGHARAILNRTKAPALLVDRDSSATAMLELEFGNLAEVWQTDFLSAAKQLRAEKRLFDMILLDLGVSSPQLDNSERGFSFARSGPLDMRMDNQSEVKAADIVNSYDEKTLADLIYRYGQERNSRRIAARIVENRPLRTTSELAKVIHSAFPHRGRIDSATRTFQALRISVNSELEQLEQALPLLVDALKTGGRIAVISFHSLEDTIVKNHFRRCARDCICPPEQPQCICDHRASLKILTKRVVTANENDSNPRARSAKLRVAMKTNTKRRVQI